MLAIIAVVSAIAVPRYAEALSRYRADAAARRVVHDLDYARRRARARSEGVTVQIDTAAGTLTINGAGSLDDTGKTWTTDLSRSPYHVKQMSTDFVDGQVTFDGYGTPDAGGVVKLMVGDETRQVVLDADTGKAAVQ